MATLISFTHIYNVTVRFKHRKALLALATMIEK